MPIHRISSTNIAHLQVATVALHYEALDPVNLPEFLGPSFRGLLGDALLDIENRGGINTLPDGGLFSDLFFNKRQPDIKNLPGEYGDLPACWWPSQGRCFGQRQLNPGEQLTIHLRLCGSAIGLFPDLIPALHHLGFLGWGRPRRQLLLRSISGRVAPGREAILWSLDKPETVTLPLPFTLEDFHSGFAVSQDLQVAVHLLQPTALSKSQRTYGALPFFQLIESLAFRASLLSAAWCGAPWIDPTSFVKPARQVGISSMNLQWQEYKRYSSRKKDHFPLHGFTGKITYDFSMEEEMQVWLPLLSLGTLLQVGRSIAFGAGVYEVEADQLLEE